MDTSHQSANRPRQAFAPFSKQAIEQSLTARFEAQVRQFPGRLAVSSAGEALSYSGLNERADRIASGLLDVAPINGKPVALLVSQGTWQIASLLGILKAGGFYAPLDEAWPKAQIRQVIDQIHPAMVLSDRTLAPLAAGVGPPGLPVLVVEELGQKGGNANSLTPPTKEYLAYAFFTSGTTGRPKGVVDNHRNVLHNVMRYTNSLRVTPDDRFTLLQHPSFSGSVSSVFTALLNGASVFPFDVRLAGAVGIAKWLHEAGITIYHSVPSLFRAVMAEGMPLPHVRLVRLEGDQATWHDVELYREHLGPDCVLVNGMGATECGMVRQFFVDRETMSTTATLPVGYAVPGMEVVIVDDAGRLVAPDELRPAVGEIGITSRHLAVGYWHQPDLTAAKFRPDARDPLSRLYLTGDVGRLHADGCLECLGRTDFQFKIRGQWVDVAAVEAAMREVPGVAEAVAAPVRDDTGENRLIGYFTAADEQPPTTNALRLALRRRLAGFMVPSAFVQMVSLPLNSNGKVDRQDLPWPDHFHRDVDTPFEPARTPLEARLAVVWSEILGVEAVGIHDNLFDLGGHSLLIARLIAQMRVELERDIPLNALLDAPTIAGLAVQLETTSTSAGHVATSLVSVQSTGTRSPLFFLPGGGGGESEYLVYARLMHGLGPDQPVYGFVARGHDGTSLPHDSVEVMASDYIDELHEVQPQGPYLLGGECTGGLIALEMAHQLRRQGQRIALLVVLNTQLPSASERSASFPRRLLAGRVARRGMQVHQLKGGQRLRFLMAMMGNAAARLLPMIPEMSQRNSILSARRHYERLLQSHQPALYIGDVTLVLTEDCAQQGMVQVWQKHVQGRLDWRQVPGNRTSYLRDEGLLVAQCLRACVESAQARE